MNYSDSGITQELACLPCKEHICVGMSGGLYAGIYHLRRLAEFMRRHKEGDDKHVHHKLVYMDTPSMGDRYPPMSEAITQNAPHRAGIKLDEDAAPVVDLSGPPNQVLTKGLAQGGGPEAVQAVLNAYIFELGFTREDILGMMDF